MYNKSIQLHTCAEQNVTSGYHTVGGGVYTKETLEMSSEMYTRTSPYDINAHLQYLYLYSGHSTRNRAKLFFFFFFFGRGECEKKQACHFFFLFDQNEMPIKCAFFQ